MPVTKKKPSNPAAEQTTEQRALAAARAAAVKAESWIELHNALFGIGGLISALFPDRAERSRFVKTKEYQAITALVEEMQGGDGNTPMAELLAGASGKVLVRIPRSVHAALLAEAAAEGISLNQLCLAKLCVQLRAAV